MKKISIQKIIYAIAGIFFISFVATLSMTYFQFKSIRENADNVFKLIASQSDAQVMRFHISQIQQFATDAALTLDEDSMKEASENKDEALKDLDKLAEFHTDDKELIVKIKDQTENLYQVAHKMVIAYQAKGVEAGNKIMKEPEVGFDAASEAIFKNVESFVDKVQADVDADIAEMHKAEEKAQMYSILTGVFFMLIVFSALWTVLTRVLTIPKLSEQLTTQTESLEGSSQELAKISSHLTDQVSQQASAIEQSASALEEITSMLKKTELESLSLSEEAHDNESVSRKGYESFESVTHSVKELQTSLELVMVEFRKGNQELGGIINLVKEIEQKTKVINDIVFQTKLLSFNASVEAARAGEAGKGFSVVAEEIAQLANLSGKSSQEINQLLAMSTQKISDIIRNSTNSLEKIIESNQRKLSESVGQLNDGGKYFSQVLEHSESFNQRALGITSALKEQMRGVEEINKAIASLQNVSQETSQSTQKSEIISRDLRDGAESLAHVTQHLSGAVLGDAA